MDRSAWDHAVRELQAVGLGVDALLASMKAAQRPVANHQPDDTAMLLRLLGYRVPSGRPSRDKEAPDRLPQHQPGTDLPTRERLVSLLADNQPVEQPPQPGASDLLPRLLRARWALLGLRTAIGPGGDPWRPEELAVATQALAGTLQEKASRTKPLTSEETLRLTLRPSELLGRIQKSDPYGYAVIDPTGTGKGAFAGLRVVHGAFEDRGLPYLHRSAETPRTLNLYDRVASELNRLTMRVLQLRLWRLGLLDGPVSDVTDHPRSADAAGRARLAALVEALDLVAGPGEEGRRILRRDVAGHYVALNLALLAPRLASLTGEQTQVLLAAAATASSPLPVPLQQVIGAADRVRHAISDAVYVLQHTMLGQPLGASRLAAGWVQDGDVILLAAPDLEATEIEAFVAKVQDLRKRMRRSLSLAIHIIALAQAGALGVAGPAGWSVLALRLAADLRPNAL